MRGSDFKKLISAGFRIFRLRNDGTIWQNQTGLAWSLYNRYPSFAEAKRRFNELMKDDKNVEG